MHLRRSLRVLLTFLGLVVPLTAQAQQAKNVPTVGYLTPNPASANLPNRLAFRESLREHGYIEGETVAIEWGDADGKVERLPKIQRDSSARSW